MLDTLIGWAVIYPLARLLRRVRFLDTPLRAAFVAGGLFSLTFAALIGGLSASSSETRLLMDDAVLASVTGIGLAWWMMRQRDRGALPPRPRPPEAYTG